jgi:hypothetical protein
MFKMDGVMGFQAVDDVKAWNDALIGEAPNANFSASSQQQSRSREHGEKSMQHRSTLAPPIASLFVGVHPASASTIWWLIDTPKRLSFVSPLIDSLVGPHAAPLPGLGEREYGEPT